MGVQKTYGYATSKGVAGGIYDMFHYPVDSRFNEEATGKLHFGVGVVTGKVPGSSVALPTSASTADNFEGVVINGFDRQQDLEEALRPEQPERRCHAPWPRLGTSGDRRCTRLW